MKDENNQNLKYKVIWKINNGFFSLIKILLNFFENYETKSKNQFNNIDNYIKNTLPYNIEIEENRIVEQEYNLNFFKNLNRNKKIDLKCFCFL